MPVSAVVELSAVTCFAIDLGMTFLQPSTGELAKAARGEVKEEEE